MATRTIVPALVRAGFVPLCCANNKAPLGGKFGHLDDDALRARALRAATGARMHALLLGRGDRHLMGIDIDSHEVIPDNAGPYYDQAGNGYRLPDAAIAAYGGEPLFVTKTGRGIHLWGYAYEGAAPVTKLHIGRSGLVVDLKAGPNALLTLFGSVRRDDDGELVEYRLLRRGGFDGAQLSADELVEQWADALLPADSMRELCARLLESGNRALSTSTTRTGGAPAPAFGAGLTYAGTLPFNHKWRDATGQQVTARDAIKRPSVRLYRDDTDKRPDVAVWEHEGTLGVTDWSRHVYYLIDAEPYAPVEWDSETLAREATPLAMAAALRRSTARIRTLSAATGSGKTTVLRTLIANDKAQAEKDGRSFKALVVAPYVAIAEQLSRELEDVTYYDALPDQLDSVSSTLDSATKHLYGVTHLYLDEAAEMVQDHAAKLRRLAQQIPADVPVVGVDASMTDDRSRRLGAVFSHGNTTTQVGHVHVTPQRRVCEYTTDVGEALAAIHEVKLANPKAKVLVLGCTVVAAEAVTALLEEWGDDSAVTITSMHDDLPRDTSTLDSAVGTSKVSPGVSMRAEYDLCVVLGEGFHLSTATLWQALARGRNTHRYVMCVTPSNSSKALPNPTKKLRKKGQRAAAQGPTAEDTAHDKYARIGAETERLRDSYRRQDAAREWGEYHGWDLAPLVINTEAISQAAWRTAKREAALRLDLYVFRAARYTRAQYDAASTKQGKRPVDVRRALLRYQVGAYFTEDGTVTSVDQVTGLRRYRHRADTVAAAVLELEGKGLHDPLHRKANRDLPAEEGTAPDESAELFVRWWRHVTEATGGAAVTVDQLSALTRTHRDFHRWLDATGKLRMNLLTALARKCGYVSKREGRSEARRYRYEIVESEHALARSDLEILRRAEQSYSVTIPTRGDRVTRVVAVMVALGLDSRNALYGSPRPQSAREIARAMSPMRPSPPRRALRGDYPLDDGEWATL